MRAPKALVRDLIALRDIALTASSGGTDAREAARVLDERLASILAQTGLRELSGDGPFDPREQEVLALRPTSDPALDRHVCETVRPGYAAGERVVRPQQVVVYELKG